MTNQIELTTERILGFDTARIAELILLVLVTNENRRITFEKRGRFVIPTGDEYELPPFPTCLAGRYMNHYRELFKIEYPARKGELKCLVDGNYAEVTCEIHKPNGLESQNLSSSDQTSTK